MKQQGSGWHGESRRHSLARKGIRTVPQGQIMTAYGIQYDQHGQVMIADGILGDLWDKAKSSITQSKLYKAMDEKIRGTPEVRQAKEEVKKQKELTKLHKLEEKKYKEMQKTIQADADRRNVIDNSPEGKALAKETTQQQKNMKNSQRQELEQAGHFGTKPSIKDVDIDNKGRIGAIKSKVASEERKVTREQLTDLPPEAFETQDADSLIAISENVEKLMDYSNELKYDINMMQVEGKRLSKLFSADEKKEIQQYRNDKTLAVKEMKKQIMNLKNTGMDEDKLKFKVNELKIALDEEYDQRAIEIGALKDRNRKTIQFIKDLSNDLSRNYIKLNKTAKRMSASGIERGDE